MPSTKRCYGCRRRARSRSPRRAAGVLAGRQGLYLAALKADLQVYSRDGIVSAGSRARSLSFLQQLDKEIAAARIDLAETWDGRFVAVAAKRN
jgi:hypothetical protein